MANAVTKIVTETSTSSSLTFTSIPATYDDLMIIASAKTDTTGTNMASNSWYMRFNGDTSAAYGFAWFGNGDASQYYPVTPSSSSLVFPGVASSNSSNTGWGHFWIHIPGYKETGNNRSIQYAGGFSMGNSTLAGCGRGAGNWDTASAITSILIGPQYGSFVSGTSMTMYGISNS
jgi:hypothetical protein|tara:strand:+ start:906 stop:1430 length:525 start_codon:yes stop_codon:yes gene_type:complete